MRSVTAREIQRLDRRAIEKIGIPSLVLMENAGRRVAEIVLKKIRTRRVKNVLVICGLGNNAGDGFVAARYVWFAGIKTKVVLIGRVADLKYDAAVNYSILKKLKFPVQEISKLNARLIYEIKKSSVVVDAIFGVGLNREIKEPFISVIKAMNQSGRYVVSIDIPSGLDATTGKICGECVRADTTVTFTLPKKGFFIKQGPSYVGRVKVVNIGIPRSLLK